MRILQVAPPWFEVPPLRYGGIELVISALADGLVAAGHEVTLLASGGSRTSANLHTVYPTAPSTDLGDTTTELLHVLAVDELAGFDIIHDHTLLGTALLVARGSRPLVHTLHAAWSDRARRVCRRLADGASLVAISHDQAARAGDVPIAAVVHNGIDLERYPVALDRREGLAFVGRASPEKGPLQAIEVARRTGRPLTMAIKVNEVEEHAYWEQVLAPQAATADVQVFFDATHEEKLATLAGAHALLAPIQWDEPFGLVLAEAGACGTPVVTYARGATPEVVQDGLTGSVIDPATGIDGLCEAVEAADAIDPATCRQFVSDHFSRDRMVSDYVELYEQLHQPRFMRARPAAFAPPFVPAHVAPDTAGHQRAIPSGRPH